MASFTLDYQVVYYDTDYQGQMTLERLAAVAILASEGQSTALKRDASFLAPLNLGWVITEYQLEITRLPHLLEQVTFTTQATSWNKFFCYRDFWIKDAAGNTLVTIHATFVLMDLKTRKMKSVTEEIIRPFGGVKENKIKRGTKFEVPADVASERIPYRVRYFDLDSNRHVNNAKYFTWLLDPLGKEFLATHLPTNVHVRFDKEVSYGETIDSVVAVTQNQTTSYHTIENATTRFAEAQITWRESATK
ncbi:acyl-[acyl-carrier-protein] thioesterase [Enterococcus nangangensis]|uniref:acyl-[acyl-carrier-protein] thioesterase n=1 Tax=Enterococcus nangangensis TaxID=2559926 RepID=UPI0010F440B8|nr:acyl-ACP thioesterase domain-containing protein [Enterococcus nangangensis]